MTTTPRTLSVNMHGDDVALLQEGLKRLGLAIHDRQGQFGESTGAAVKDFQRKHGLEVTGTVDPQTGQLLARAVESVARTRPGEQDNPFVVTGQVVSAVRVPVPGITVRAFDKEMRGEPTLLGEAVTDKEGRYSITYTKRQFRRSNKVAADLFLQVRSGDGPLLFQTDTRFRVREKEAIDLSLPASNLPSEFEALLATIEPAMVDVGPSELSDTDVDYLVNATGQSRERISLLRGAMRMAKETGASPEFFYALGRAGFLVNDLSVPRAKQKEALRTDIEKAITANIVPAALKSKLLRDAEQIYAASIREALTLPSDPTRVNAGALFAQSGLSEPAKERMLELAAEHLGDPNDFWERLAEAPEFADTTQVEEARVSLELATLTGYHAPLLLAFQSMRKAGRLKTLKEMAAWDEQEWLALVRQHGAPKDVPGDDQATREVNYAAALLAQVEAAFPTAAFAARIAKSDLPLRDELTQIFNAHPGFDLLSDSVDSTVGSSISSPVVQQLKHLQRLARVCPQFGVASALMKAGIRSAQHIASMSQGAFAANFKGLANEDELRAIHTIAARRKATVYNLRVRYGGEQDYSRFASVPPELHIRPGVLNPLPEAPIEPGTPETPSDWTALFGSPDACECDHSRSVLGPAAYLVDLLQFVKFETTDQKGISVLFAANRRPDIKDIRLNGENTDTPMPYVDLVCEILEQVAAKKDSVDAYQTTWSQDELAAHPEHIQNSAYTDVLSRAIYPWNLPLDVESTEARIYLTQLGTTRTDVMETFYVGSPLRDVAIATEYLGLTTTEWNLIAGLVSHQPWELWGLKEELQGHVCSPVTHKCYRTQYKWYEWLSRADRLVARAGITLDELQRLLLSGFVNWNGSLNFTYDGEGSSLAKTKVNFTDDVDALGRICRFVRLLRALGWSIEELDTVLCQVGGTKEISQATLLVISHLQRLKDRIQVPVTQLLPFFLELNQILVPKRRDETINSSLYQRAFLDQRMVGHEENEKFVATLTLAHPPHPLPAIGDFLPHVTAALGCSAADVEWLLNWTPPDSGPDYNINGLTCQNLSLLYRVVRFCRMTRLAVSEFTTLVDITGIIPVRLSAGTAASELPAHTLSFLDELAYVRDSGFSIVVLGSLLSGKAPKDAAETSLLKNAVVLQRLRVALQQVATTNALPEQSDLTTLEALLRQKLSLLLEPEEVELVVGWANSEPPDSQTGTPDGRKARLDTLSSQHPELAFLSLTTLYPPLPDDEAQRTQDLAIRFRTLLDNLLGYLCQTQARCAAKQQIAQALELEVALVEGLTEKWVKAVGSDMPAIGAFLDSAFVTSQVLLSSGVKNATSIVQQEYPEQKLVADTEPFRVAFQTLAQLQKVAVVLERLKITFAEACYLFSEKRNGWLDPTKLAAANLPSDRANLYQAWRRLVDVCKLRDRVGSKEPRLFDLLELASSVDTVRFDQFGKFYSVLVDRMGWNRADFEKLVGHFRYTLADFRDERALLRLESCFRLSSRLGVTISAPWNMLEWAELHLKPGVAKCIQRAARAGFTDDKAWSLVARPLQDGLRERKRSALVGYLTAAWDWTPEQLYSHFLIDPEMSPSMLTSRIKQAISSVQLFVQRLFLGMEDEVKFSDPKDAEREWQWRRNYRVWEANRKVFLYPENWIEPELRDDKSPFFKELENELRQQEITAESVEDAYVNYLKKLDAVSNLEIVGQCSGDADTKPSEASGWAKQVHVLGRTRNPPFQYFYRRRDKHKNWAPWEKVGCDVEGEYLMPVVWNRRLYLFWPIFKEERDTSPFADDPNPLVSMSRKVPARHWTVQLAWSALWQGTWSPQTTSVQTITPMRWLSISGLVATTEWSVAPDGTEVQLPANGSPVRHEGPIEVSDTILVFEREAQSSVRSGESDILSLKESFAASADNRRLFSFDLKIDVESGTLRIALYYPKFARNVSVSETVRKRAWRAGSDEVTRHLGGSHERMLGEPPSFAGSFVVDPIMRVTPSADSAPAEGGSAYFSTSKSNLENMYLLGVGACTYEVGQWPLPGGGAEVTSVTYSLRHLWDSSCAQFRLFFPEHVASQYWYNFYYQDDSVTLRCSNIPHLGRPLTMFSHPFAGKFISSLHRDGLDGLLRGPEFYRQKNVRAIFGTGGYLTNPSSNLIVVQEVSYPAPSPDIKKPREDITFEDGEAYALYNWELFFHIPLMLADRLSKNQRFEEAMRWYHYIFDPLSPDRNDSAKYEAPWRMGRLYDHAHVRAAGKSIEQLLRQLHESGSSERTNLLDQIEEWQDDPFKPHLLARHRITPYMKVVVAKYIDNLVAWADQLFRRDTIESINEATQLYILAYELLGPRPQELLGREHVDRTYAELEPYLDEFSNALEDEIPEAGLWSVFDWGSIPNVLTQLGTTGLQALGLQFVMGGPVPHSSSRVRELGRQLGTSGGRLGDGIVVFPDQLVRTTPPPTPPSAINLPPAGLYFGIPQNGKLVGYWDAVGDRLFKIRHGMSIEGQLRELPLFEPEIDPALLVKAAAAGIDFSTVLNDLSAPMPRFRFSAMVQKASELCQEAKSLGSALLSALEKGDGEGLALLRSEHEIRMLESVREVRKLQVKESTEACEGLRRTKDVTLSRLEYYQGLIDTGLLPEEEAHIIQIKNAKELLSSAADSDKTASRWANAPDIVFKSGTLQGTVPSGSFGIPGFSLHNSIDTSVTGSYGGSTLARRHQSLASMARADADGASRDAELSGIAGNNSRRKDDWEHQVVQAKLEMKQLDKQIAAAELRTQIAEKERENLDQQMADAKAVDEYMRSKFSNEELYEWTKGQLAAVYFLSYQLAYDTAKRAERALGFELGVEKPDFIHFGYWDSLRKGLLSGEQLFLDIKRMEVAYLEQTRREYEITKHVSLLQLDPEALVRLKDTGTCDVEIPESLFDLDYPGHYMRRIKAVSLTIPCIAGPFTSVNCTLSLLKHSLRRRSELLSGNQYERDQEGEDLRFSESFGAIQSIVTSHGQNDSGLFELNFRDERYLPFEGAGAISAWRIQLPDEFRQFDYNTIADVILQLRYTARDGGTPLRNAAIEHLKGLVAEAKVAGSVRLFSIRQEFGAAWAKFASVQVGGDTSTASIAITLREEHFPYWSRGRVTNVVVSVFVAGATGEVSLADAGGNNSQQMRALTSCTAILVARVEQPFDIVTDPEWRLPVSFSLTNNRVRDVMLEVTWS